MSVWVVIPVMLALLAASAFFSAAETAFFSLQREEIARFRESGRRRAGLVASLLEHPRELLATVLFGNLVANTLLYALSALMAYRLAAAGEHLAAGIVGVGGLVVVIVAGEILPKSLSLGFNKTVSLSIAVPMYAIYEILRPVRYAAGEIVRATTAITLRLVRPTTRITREELSMLVETTGAQGHIPPQEGEMIEGVMGLGETRVREIMVPRVDVVACTKESSLEDLIETFRRTRRTKVLVYDGNLDRIVGVAHVRDAVLSGAKTLAGVTQAVSFVPEAKTAEALLYEFQQNKTSIAVVVDEYGGTAGVVTLADVAREIVGPIGDEYETPLSPVEALDAGVYRLAGDISIKEWNELFGTQVGSQRLSTLGGFIVMLVGRVPRAGDSVLYKNIRFTVEEVRRHRIVSVKAELMDESGQPSGGGA